MQQNGQFQPFSFFFSFFFLSSGGRVSWYRDWPALCTEPHGKGSTSQAKVLQGKQECSADWAPDKLHSLQTNSRNTRGTKTSRPAAVLLAGVEQNDPKPLGIRDNGWLQDPILKPTTKYRNSSFLLFKMRTESDLAGDTIYFGQKSDQGNKTRSRFREQHLVPKSGQRWRLILNLKVLNSYTVSKHFKTEVPGAYTPLGKPMVI